MKSRKIKKLFIRLMALTLVTVMMTVDASAIVKDVFVWGVKSINDKGQSDVKITLEELEQDYSGYFQADGLTEYFHKDQGEIPKTGMTEALAWLIENQIISRDSVISISSVYGRPTVSIVKEDISTKMYSDVTRSDALMYIYKSVFGPLNGRVIGVEAISTRVENGIEESLLDMMINHGYLELRRSTSRDEITQSTTPGSSTHGYEYIGQVHIDIGGEATPGTAEQKIVSYIDTTAWRYTPQGDKVVSIFGDTNLFISDVDITQDIDTSGYSGNHGSGGVVTGTGQALIDYDTDYKEIFYVPGADLWMYKTTDVLEMYLQSLQSKGILEFEQSLRTDEYNETFLKLVEDGAAKASWSGDADPYVVNLTSGSHIRAENVAYAPVSKVLGKMYSASFIGSTLTLRRNPLFETESGYFTTETVTRMDVYRYIYSMVQANEKKLTALEADIVNYKYGLQYGDGLPDGDLEVIKFLVAKGILNFDGSDELDGLYAPMTWSQLIPILYRVANTNARLDFSQVQLTDSEQAWKAQGFAPSTLNIYPSNSMSELTMEYTDEYYANMVLDIDPDVSDDGVQQLSMKTSYVKLKPKSLWQMILEFFGFGKDETLKQEVGAPVIDMDAYMGRSSSKSSSKSSNPFVMTVRAADDKVADIVFNTNAGMLCMNHQLYFDFMGATHLHETDFGLDAFKELLTQIDTNRSYVYSYLGDSYNATNPKHRILVEYLQNFHFLAALKSDSTVIATYKEALLDWANNPSDTIKNNTTINESMGWTVTWKDARMNFAKDAIAKLENAGKGKNVPTNVVYHNVSTNNLSSVPDDLTVDHCTSIAQNLCSTLSADNRFYIEFDYTTSSGQVAHQELKFNEISAETKIDTDANAAKALNAASVQLRQAVKASDLTANQDAVLIAQAGSKIEAMYRDSGIYFAGDSDEDSNYYNYFSNTTLDLYADPTSLDQGYVKWSDIQSASGGSIVRQSELILVNTETQTTAYFSYDTDPSKTRAIVGAIVINGDSKYGVVKKVNENGVDEIYYHLSAVRQLMSLSDEKECIGGRSCIAMSDEIVIENTKSYPVTNSLGTQSSSVSAVRAVVHTRASQGDSIHSTNQYYKAGVTLGERHYCNFISLAQSNRVANIIYRKFTYTPDVEESISQTGRGVAYGVVVFRAADVDEVGSPSVSSSTSLQDLLDAPGQPPSGDQTIWNQNMKMCNDYANWIYGTTNVSYVNTGYLTPEAYLFIVGDAETKRPPNAIYGSLTNAERRAINMGEMGVVTVGRTAKRDATADSSTNNYNDSNNNFCSYYVDTGYRAMLSGDRLFLNEAMFENISFKKVGNNYSYVLQNSTQVVSPFSVGNVFTFFSSADGRDYGNPTARVTAVSSSGEVTVQIGPFIGMPVRYNGQNTVVASSYANSTTSFSAADWKTTVVGGEKTEGCDLWSQFYCDAGKQGLTKDWVDGANGNVITPALFGARDSSASVRVVFDGTNMKVYEDDKTVNITKAVTVSTGTTTFKEAYTALKNKFSRDSTIFNSSTITNKLTKVEAYYEVKFSAWHYSVKNGVLTYNTNTGMSAFLNPALFTNINDLLIDKMMDESSGAIAVNDIPAGSLLKIGDYYYQAVGTSNDSKVFVGYAPLYEYVEKPAVVHAAKAFTTQMVYAGNQYINVSHWIDPFTMLQHGKQSSALDAVAKKTLVGDQRQKYSVDFNGDVKSIDTGVQTSGDTSAMFSPVEIRFQDGLLAYKGPTVEQIQGTNISPLDENGEAKTQAGGVDTYILCNHAGSAVSGALDEVPFLVDDVLNVSLYSVTTDIVTAGFKLNDSAPGLRDVLQREFQKVFAGDLLTLVRMLIFLVLIWLVVASWMCYFMWLGNLLPILEAIRYPSGDRGKKGIDLMQIVSLGTITMDTEFKLGRFLQYNCVLAILMCVIMLTG